MKHQADKCIYMLFLGVFLWGPLAALNIDRVTCERMELPLAVVADQPRLGWRLVSDEVGDRQTAWQVLVASTPERLARDEGDLWNSGKVAGNQSQYITYAGKLLQPSQRCYWKVKVWDARGKPCAWSSPAWWQMAPDLTVVPAQWIGAIRREDSHLPAGRNYHAPRGAQARLWDSVAPLATRSIQLRKEMVIEKKITRATLYVSGLGQYQLTIDGHKVGNSEFAPLWSDYDKTVYYNTYEVQDMLATGPHAIGVLLGNGMYNVTGNRYRKFLISFGPPTLFFRLDITYADGTSGHVVSDSSWQYAESPITFNCIFGGEDYNATLAQPGWDLPGFNAATWQAVVIQDPPQGTLRTQQATPVEHQATYAVKEVTTPQPQVFVFNMGQNLSGYPAIQVKGKPGQVIKIKVGESLTADGLVSQKRTGGPYLLQYTLKGDTLETWHPHFTYYGFQYIQVEGVDYQTASGQDVPLLQQITSHFLYNAGGEAGSFTCSNDIFNKAHWLINNAIKSNWQSVFTDCPHREKLGWLEETYLNGPGLFYNYHLGSFIPKVMQDIADAQRPDGLIPCIAPEYVVFGGDFTDSPEWGLAGVVLPWMYYQFYGDPSLIETYYPVMKRYVDYLTTTATDGIVSHGLGDWYDYGDHVAGYAKNTPIPLSATAHYYYGITLVAKAAKFLGKAEDAKHYKQLAEYIRLIYQKTFYHPDTQQYATGSQYAHAISIFLNLVAPADRAAVLDHLTADIAQHGNRLTTGDIGNRYLYQVLARNGKNDVMYALHNHYDAPGYGFQIKFGLTTLTEQWDPRKGNSWNHFMMGQIEEWFYRSLAGMVPAEDGFQHFYIQPVVVGDLTSVDAAHETLYGTITVHWQKQAGQFTLAVTVPVNTTAEVTLPLPPAGEIRVNGRPLKKVKSIKTIDQPGNTFAVGSGQYTFTYPY